MIQKRNHLNLVSILFAVFSLICVASFNIELTPKAVPVRKLVMASTTIFDTSSSELSVTIMPENASNKEVDWSLSFSTSLSNEQQSWLDDITAQGRTVSDFVTIEPVFDGSCVAHVTMKEYFGAQIIATATSRSNKQLSSSCTIDCAERISDFSFVLGSYDLASDCVTIEYTGYQNDRPVLDYKSSVHTVLDTHISGEKSYWSFSFEFSQEFINAFYSLCEEYSLSIALPNIVFFNDYYNVNVLTVPEALLLNFYLLPDGSYSVDPSLLQFLFFRAYEDEAVSVLGSLLFEVNAVYTRFSHSCLISHSGLPDVGNFPELKDLLINLPDGMIF